MKKSVLNLSAILVCVLFLGIVSSASCEILPRAECGDEDKEYIVMGVSGLTNAHGEFPDILTYNFVLCCDFGTGMTDCSLTKHPIYGISIPQNKILGLSSFTNAHAERCQDSNYDIEVCYAGLTCVDTEANCDVNYPLGIASLSGTTNAHIGKYQDYSRNICCNVVECRPEVAYCEDYFENECNVDPCRIASDEIEFYGYATCGGSTICSCEWNGTACGPIWEEVITRICGDKFIDPTLGETCDGTTMPTGEDCSGSDSCTGGIISCYAPGHKKECRLDYTACTGCSSVEGICGDGVKDLGETCECGVDGICGTADDNLYGRTCLNFNLEGTGLSCYPAGTINECTFDTTGCESPYPSKIGKCINSKSTQDTCEDGLISYTWTAEWEWSEENIALRKSPDVGGECEEDYVLDGLFCYYDKNKASETCVGGSKIVPCPAQVQLPFFDYYGLIVTLVVVAFVYFIVILKDKKKKLRKINSKKKKK